MRYEIILVFVFFVGCCSSRTQQVTAYPHTDKHSLEMGKVVVYPTTMKQVDLGKSRFSLNFLLEPERIFHYIAHGRQGSTFQSKQQQTDIRINTNNDKKTTNTQGIAPGEIYPSDNITPPYHQILYDTANTILGGQVLENLYKTDPRGTYVEDKSLFIIPILISFKPGTITRKNYNIEIFLDFSKLAGNTLSRDDFKVLAIAPHGYTQLITENLSSFNQIGLGLGASGQVGAANVSGQFENIRSELNEIARVVQYPHFKANVECHDTISLNYYGQKDHNEDIHLVHSDFHIEVIALCNQFELITQRNFDQNKFDIKRKKHHRHDHHYQNNPHEHQETKVKNGQQLAEFYDLLEYIGYFDGSDPVNKNLENLVTSLYNIDFSLLKQDEYLALVNKVEYVINNLLKEKEYDQKFLELRKLVQDIKRLKLGYSYTWAFKPYYPLCGENWNLEAYSGYDSGQLEALFRKRSPVIENIEKISRNKILLTGNNFDLFRKYGAIFTLESQGMETLVSGNIETSNSALVIEFNGDISGEKVYLFAKNRDNNIIIHQKFTNQRRKPPAPLVNIIHLAGEMNRKDVVVNLKFKEMFPGAVKRILIFGKYIDLTNSTQTTVDGVKILSQKSQKGINEYLLQLVDVVSDGVEEKTISVELFAAGQVSLNKSKLVLER
ncbi:hypothetical protein [Candidatus Uabimicrobium sp. HlEnr_7]|uniref:hypothetical protein n=1 Tax=Candidatus Uabimicrobium helgolandensis TaxID=3095367 RepID=UPI003556DADB